MGEPDNPLELSSSVGPHVRSYLRAWIDGSGLVIEGQDLGPLVDSMWGDSDYEYWLRIDRVHLDAILTALAEKLGLSPETHPDRTTRDSRILELLKRSWTEGEFSTDVEFRQWLESVGIPSQFSSYS